MRARNAIQFLLVFLLGSVIATAASAQAQKLFERVTGVALTAEQQRAVDRIRAMPTTANVEIVKVDARVLRTADIIDVSVDPAFRGALPTRAKRDRGQDSFTWMATSQGSDDSSAVFTVTSGVVGGSIFADKPYSIEPIGGGLNAFVTTNPFTGTDPNKFTPDHPAEAGKRSTPTQKARSVVANLVVIDVLVVLTKRAAALFPGAAERLNWVQRAIDTTNLTYLNSGVAIELRLSSSSPHLVDYEERGTPTDLRRLIMTNDLDLNGVHGVRSSDKADVVILIVAKADGFCGRAATTMASKEEAFAMVSAHCPIETLAFAHEIGHLQGASHDDEEGFFPHGHGHCKTSGDGTVMSSRRTCPNRKPQWSRPPVWGSLDKADNVRVLNETASEIAAFLP
jgi:peptidyl-Asp metalloendopeptidase